MNTEGQQKLTSQIQFAYLTQVYQLLYQYSLLSSFLSFTTPVHPAPAAVEHPCSPAAKEKSTSGPEKINQDEHPEKPASKSISHQGKRINSTILASGATYDPVTARFNREDPLKGNPQTPPSLHRYLYANANPTVYIDPDGRRSTIEQHSYLDYFKQMLSFDNDTNSDEIAIKIEMERMRVAEQGLPTHSNKRKPKNNIFNMMNAIEKSKNSELLRVAESATNNLFLEMGISKSEVLKRAHLSNCIYNPECDTIDKSIGNITRLRGDDLKPYEIDENELNGTFSGFKAGIFKDHDRNEIIFTFAGTDGLIGGDMLTNIIQSIGISPSQYDQARELAIRAAAGAKRNNQEISFTGHSMGGGLAQVASLVTGKKSTTFNSAGLNVFVAVKALYAEGLIGDDGSVKGGRGNVNEYINSIYVRGEILSGAQDFVPLLLPDALGRRIKLERGSTSWFLGQHGSINVCRALGSTCDYSKK